MEFNPGDTIQIRAKFTDGNGNYSRNYTYAEITLQAEDEDVPNVEDFMLFSWGSEVWAAWEPNEYQTEVEYLVDEEWSNLGEEFVSAGIGEA